MTIHHTDQVNTASPPELAEHAGLSDDAQRLLAPVPTVDAAIPRLLEWELYSDALGLTAFFLTTRPAVWWGCVCLGDLLGPEIPEEEAEPIRAAMAWVANPSEATRREAGQAGKEAGLGTATGLVAMAAFWSGGSMSEPHLPEVLPKPYQANRAVSGAMNLLWAEQPQDQKTECCRKLLGYAAEIVKGERHWRTSYPNASK
ncbi:hypothetical protein Pan216_21580 [Planctomycetes bacterium Pan216]|uniref:Uncharacterized protein n=1 Tax=Kolteria novifilia TaxID=2527975 RepID=A0A518B2T7_9BACT|nr:hypothetical protein Pan216_21580 [Planctomycetes bacterium Pan216]